MRHLIMAALGTVVAIGIGNEALFASNSRLSFLADNSLTNLVTGSIDTTVTGSVSNAPKVPLLVYESELKKDGTLEVRLEDDARRSGPQKRDVLTVFAPNVRTTEKLLHSQDWYLTMDSNGTMRGIYTVPRDSALPSSVLRNLGEGHGIMKVDPQNSFFKVFPSEIQIASQLTTFAEAARKTVCADHGRPETLTASVDVKPGWAAAGRITFNATWNTSDLCKPQPAAKPTSNEGKTQPEE